MTPVILKSLNANELKSSQSSDEFRMSISETEFENKDLINQAQMIRRHFSIHNQHRLSVIQATPTD